MVVNTATIEAISPELLTITEVARMLHAHPNSVRRWANQGLLRCYRVGVRGDRRFKSDEVDQFLEAAYERNGNGPNGDEPNGHEPSDKRA